MNDSIVLLRTQSLATLVNEALEKQIAQGQIHPGTPLREAAVANEMGISRGPVREAFRMLEERGLVIFEKNCGVRVRTLDLSQAEQIYQVRIPLEALIGEQITNSLTVAVSDSLHVILKQMRDSVEKKDIADYSLLNFHFHDFLALSTNNLPLYEVYRRLVVQLKLFRNYTFRHDPQSIVQSCHEHCEIVAAIESGDAEHASARLREHAALSLQRLKTVSSK
ncbi:FCD domain-containing protein [Klebsiella aerogenes]|uniref:FCD domain-containing protein n=1 Tax=Klebsiella aerogenes TaxID=548 RepID=UPI0022784A97|nr:FCD domain-containing protein [Klebsiella aerogenes]MCY4763649.1 FCD domain-containing protein [Klebsiella aerogenes]